MMSTKSAAAISMGPAKDASMRQSGKGPPQLRRGTATRWNIVLFVSKKGISPMMWGCLNSFTSSDPHYGILSYSIWYSFWQSIRHPIVKFFLAFCLAFVSRRAPQHLELVIWCPALTPQCRNKTGVMAASEGRRIGGRRNCTLVKI